MHNHRMYMGIVPYHFRLQMIPVKGISLLPLPQNKTIHVSTCHYDLDQCLHVRVLLFDLCVQKWKIPKTMGFKIKLISFWIIHECTLPPQKKTCFSIIFWWTLLPLPHSAHGTEVYLIDARQTHRPRRALIDMSCIVHWEPHGTSPDALLRGWSARCKAKSMVLWQSFNETLINHGFINHGFIDVCWFGQIWGFPEIKVPQNRWFISGNISLKGMIWGYPDFRKPQFGRMIMICMIWAKCWTKEQLRAKCYNRNDPLVTCMGCSLLGPPFGNSTPKR